jgi:uncharacterized damage-inducible protein DinB
MNGLDISRLYDYVILSRRKFLSQFRALGWEEFVRNREASWNSLQGIFIHLLEVEDSWLHYDIAGKPWPFGDREPSVFKNFDEVENYERDLTQKTRRLLGSLSDEELSKEISFSEGKEKGTVEDILIHAFIDEVAHLGEFVCLMWQMDVKPSYIDWIDLHSKTG